MTASDPPHRPPGGPGPTATPASDGAGGDVPATPTTPAAPAAPAAGELTPLTDLSPPRLQFPCDYPVKVVARATPQLRSHLDAIVERHVGPLDLSQVAERVSAHNNFVSVTYTIQAQGPEQIAELFEALKGNPQVVMVL